MPPVSLRSVAVHKPNPTHAQLVLLLGALLFVAGTAYAQSRGLSRPFAFKQISPGVGWMMEEDGPLLWTDNDGAVWRDITPCGPATGDLSTVYALDPSRSDEYFICFGCKGGNSWQLPPARRAFDP